jgi:uncharacterized membrane protein
MLMVTNKSSEFRKLCSRQFFFEKSELADRPKPIADRHLPPQPSQAPAMSSQRKALGKSMDVQAKQKHANKAAWGAMVAGAALSVYGWTRKSASGAALGIAGGAIALKAASAGPIADMVGTETSLTHCVIVMANSSDIYSFCKSAGNVPLWIRPVRELSSGATQSGMENVQNPASGTKLPELHIVEDVPDQRICWRIADHRRGGRESVAELKLSSLPTVRGTLVALTVRFKLHTGILPSTSSQLIGADPQQHVRETLRKLKMLIEAGEIATIRGQSHGPRTLKGKLIGTLLGEEVA